MITLDQLSFNRLKKKKCAFKSELVNHRSIRKKKKRKSQNHIPAVLFSSVKRKNNQKLLNFRAYGGGGYIN